MGLLSSHMLWWARKTRKGLYKSSERALEETRNKILRNISSWIAPEIQERDAPLKPK